MNLKKKYIIATALIGAFAPAEFTYAAWAGDDAVAQVARYEEEYALAQAIKESMKHIAVPSFETLMKAIEAGDNEFVQECIEKGINLNKADNAGNTPLLVALRSQNEIVTKRLVFAGAQLSSMSHGNSNTLFDFGAGRDMFLVFTEAEQIKKEILTMLDSLVKEYITKNLHKPIGVIAFTLSQQLDHHFSQIINRTDIVNHSFEYNLLYNYMKKQWQIIEGQLEIRRQKIAQDMVLSLINDKNPVETCTHAIRTGNTMLVRAFILSGLVDFETINTMHGGTLLDSIGSEEKSTAMRNVIIDAEGMKQHVLEDMNNVVYECIIAHPAASVIDMANIIEQKTVYFEEVNADTKLLNVLVKKQLSNIKARLPHLIDQAYVQKSLDESVKCAPDAKACVEDDAALQRALVSAVEQQNHRMVQWLLGNCAPEVTIEDCCICGDNFKDIVYGKNEVNKKYKLSRAHKACLHLICSNCQKERITAQIASVENEGRNEGGGMVYDEARAAYWNPAEQREQLKACPLCRADDKKGAFILSKGEKEQFEALEAQFDVYAQRSIAQGRQAAVLAAQAKAEEMRLAALNKLDNDAPAQQAAQAMEEDEGDSKESASEVILCQSCEGENELGLDVCTWCDELLVSNKRNKVALPNKQEKTPEEAEFDEFMEDSPDNDNAFGDNDFEEEE